MAAPKKASLKFGEPPPPAVGNHAYDWNTIAKNTRKRPMEWALVFTEDKASLVTAIRINGITALRKTKGFEVRTRNNKRPPGLPRTCDLYVRYNPELDTEGSN